MRLVFIILVVSILVTDISGQVDSLKHKNDSLPDKFYVIQKIQRNGETLPEVEIKEVTIPARPSPVRKSDYRKYERLVSNLKRVYPYALLVRKKLSEVNEDLKNIPNEKQRKEYMKSVEKNVFDEYKGDMEQMTISQGKLLIKLIDRETQNTSYALIREYRGKFSAAFWQGIARFFGTNLKEEYDPFGDDALIELIIREIDAGTL
jgi:exonuclease I